MPKTLSTTIPYISKCCIPAHPALEGEASRYVLISQNVQCFHVYFRILGPQPVPLMSLLGGIMPRVLKIP